MPTANQFEPVPPPLSEQFPRLAAGTFPPDHADPDALRDARRILMPEAGRIVEEFYRQLCATPDAPDVPRDAGKLRALKAAMRRWIEEAVLRPDPAGRGRRRLERLSVCHLRVGASLGDIVKALTTMQRVCRDVLREAVRTGRLASRSYPAVLEAFRQRVANEQLGFVAAYLKDLTGPQEREGA